MNQMGKTGEKDHERLKQAEKPGFSAPKRRHLPSLGSFATFEVAAKHLSFTQAASELFVTQVAVSQQIRGLEKALGCRLFLRKRKGMELTPEGETLLEAVSRGLDTFSDAIFRIGNKAERSQITIAGTHAGIMHFMKPVTDSFREKHPDIRFTLLASDENDRLQDFEEVDLSFICGNERTEIGRNPIRLFPEIVDPVCAPSYLETIGKIRSPDELAGVSLMELHRMHWSSEAISWYPVAWRDWFHLHVPSVDEPEPDFVTNSYNTLIDAALGGDGVILGWRHLVQHLVQQGRLVRLLDCPLDTGRSYYMKVNQEADGNPIVQMFIDHLKREIERFPVLQGGSLQGEG